MYSVLFRQFLCWIWLLTGTAALAQAPRQFVFTRYDSENGLPSNRINDIRQDEKGFLWLATPEGLARFDGARSKLFRKRRKDPKSPPFSYVNQLHIDARNRLWLLHSYDQAGYFNTSTHTYTPVKIMLEDTTLKNIGKGYIARTGDRVFLGVGGREILVFDEQMQAFKPAHEFFPRQPDWQILVFWQQPGNPAEYGAVIKDHGIFIYNTTTGVMSRTGQNTANHPLINMLDRFKPWYFRGFLFDQKNRLWFSVGNGVDPRVYCYDLTANRFLIEDQQLIPSPHPYYEIWDFIEQKNGAIWVRGTNVLGWFDETRRQFVNIPRGTKVNEQMDYSMILQLYEDRDHNLWVATHENGLYRFNPERFYFTNVSYKFKHSDELSINSPLTFLPDKDGTILANVWGDGFYRFDQQLNRLPLDMKNWKESSSTACWDVCFDRDSNFAWFACQPGIYKYNRAEKTGVYYNPEIFQHRTIRQVEMDPQGNLWFGTQGLGVIKWDRQTGAQDFEKGFSTVESVNINRPVNHITIDRKGWVWIATGEFGLYVLDSKTNQLLMHFFDKATGFEQIPEPGVSQVLDYDDSLVVFATSQEVLLFNRQLKTTRIIRQEDAIEGLIATMEKDRDGNIWMGTTNKLYRFHPHKKITLSFDRRDGIFDDQFVLSASKQLPDGRILMGCDKQFIVFDPYRIKPVVNHPTIVVSDIKINYQDCPVDSLLNLPQIELKSGHNAMVIDFSPLVFDNWNAIQYKMEGLDQDWINADKDNQAVYNYLPPGTYRFLFRTINPEQTISEEQYVFTIKVYPPFYLSWWFYLLLLLLAGTVLYWLDHERTRRKSLVEQVRNKIADDLHQEVHTALEGINILSEMANMKTDQNPQKSREYIAQIHQKSRSMIVAMDDMLWGISPQNDGMGSTVSRIQEFVSRVNAEYDAQVDLLIDDKVKSLELDMKIRYEAFVLFKEGLLGLVRACPEGLQLHMTYDRPYLSYTAYYDNNNYNEAPINNLVQRHDLFKRLRAINATWNWQKQGKGFVFELKIPV